MPMVEEGIELAHTVIQTSEPALYANIILRRGVIYPA